MKKRTLFFYLIFLAVIFSPFFIFSQESECKTREECEKLLSQLEAEIKRLENLIAQTQKEKKSRENQILLLKNKIQQLELQIHQTNLKVKDLNSKIKETTNSILQKTLELEDSKAALTIILRTIYEEEEKSLIEILLTEKSLASFFDKLSKLEILNRKQKEVVKTIKELKNSLERQKEELEKQKLDFERMIRVGLLQKQEMEDTKAQHELILKMTSLQYEQYVKNKKELEKRAAEIMARIARLTLPGLDIPHTQKELYQLALWAEKLTGTRASLILGLIEVESALGTNVGQCNCQGQPVCRHPQLSYKQVMPSSHWEAFEKICRELNLNPNTTPVSCYVGEGAIQWGGAMGPAQFMPKTWLIYKPKIEALTGIKPANPWRTSDAFLAAALYLADFNASTKKIEDERGAVTAYLCGTPYLTPQCKAAGGEWYTNLVLKKAQEWEELIKMGF